MSGCSMRVSNCLPPKRCFRDAPENEAVSAFHDGFSPLSRVSGKGATQPPVWTGMVRKRDTKQRIEIVASSATSIFPVEGRFGRDENYQGSFDKLRRIHRVALRLFGATEVRLAACFAARCESRPAFAKRCCTKAPENEAASGHSWGGLAWGRQNLSEHL